MSGVGAAIREVVAAELLARALDFRPTYEIATRGKAVASRAGSRGSPAIPDMTREQVQSKLDVLRANLGRLSRIPQSSLDEFRSDFRNVDATLHILQTSIQASTKSACTRS